MNTQLDIFNVHQKERTAKGTAIVQAKQLKLGGNCKKLMKFWQEKWYWLTEKDMERMIDVNNGTQRVHDLIKKNGVEIEKEQDDLHGFTKYRLKCKCHLIGGVKHVEGCLVHDPKKKIL